MVLTKLEIHHVRNIKHLSISPNPAINFFYGPNGSGKSAILEAIFILGRAKSFRNNSISKVIQLNADAIIISGTSNSENRITSQLGIQLSGKYVEIRINTERNVSRSDLAYCLPVQVIHPKSYQLMDDGAKVRREFIDWGVFNLFDEFLPVWRNFNKVLKQRNILLKQKQLTQLKVWNQEFAQYGTIVHTLRSQYFQLLEPVFYSVVKEFFNFETVQLKLISGWVQDKDLLVSLNDCQEKDLQYGYTSIGPHRADFKLAVNDQVARDFVSRGQMKLIILALKIAQVKLLKQQRDIHTCVLVDDITAELDKTNRSRLLKYLATLDSQIFITATHREEFGDISQYKNHTMFHVEHGQITPE